ncbi:MAG TPA: class I SAM-dependent methyltransferase [Fimbriimonadaceae bacterium]|nr:class I SAM-dependent methyltransferase [Fimbriimonadaceae bacterium]
MNPREMHEGNRDAWNRTARAGYGAEVEADVAMLRSGGMKLMDAERGLLGDLRGRCGRAIHLQCSHGVEALSLLSLGADEVVGVDISEVMLERAGQKAEALGARATWIRADILETPHDLDGTADLVYTGKGAICWMMDLDAWAAVVARLLKPGGRLFLFEGHPLDFLWEEEEPGYVLRPSATYFQGAPTPERGFPYGAALRADPDRPVNLTSRVWTIGETVTAVVKAGLRIEHLEEFGEPFWDQFKEIPPEELRRLPHTFALIATKE